MRVCFCYYYTRIYIFNSFFCVWYLRFSGSSWWFSVLIVHFLHGHKSEPVYQLCTELGHSSWETTLGWGGGECLVEEEGKWWRRMGGGWNSPFLLTETHWLSFKAVQRGGVVVEDNDEWYVVTVRKYIYYKTVGLWTVSWECLTPFPHLIFFFTPVVFEL